MSRRLTERSIDHVVLERGEVANSWRTERWDSLRLLTPNWQTRLPGLRYDGDDPDGFMTMPEVVDVHRRLRRRSPRRSRPARPSPASRATGTGSGTGYEVTTDRGVWTCATVVLASGAANVAHVPPLAQGAPTSVDDGHADDVSVARRSRRAAACSSSARRRPGSRLADEIHRSGRPVTLAVGEHVRLPRTYRGRDIFWWMDAAGVLDERYDEVDDLVRARHVPSPQLIGTPERRSIDLNTLVERGVEIVGRLGRHRRRRRPVLGRARQRLHARRPQAEPPARRPSTSGPERQASTSISTSTDRLRANTADPSIAPSLEIDLRRAGIGTIIWATGYRPDHSWLDLPVFDHKGRIRHDGGVVRDAPGIYLLGANLLRRRRSSFINGAESDTDELSSHLQRYLDSCCRPPKRRPVPVS